MPDIEDVPSENTAPVVLWKRRGVTLAAGFVAGALLTGAAVWFLVRPRPGGEAHPLVVVGTVEVVNGDGSIMTFAVDEGQPLLQWGRERHQGFGIKEVQTLGLDGSWHRGPVCIPPGSRGTRLEVAIVRVKASHGGPGKEVIAWMKCLSEPTKERQAALPGYPLVSAIEEILVPDGVRVIEHDFKHARYQAPTSDPVPWVDWFIERYPPNAGYRDWIYCGGGDSEVRTEMSRSWARGEEGLLLNVQFSPSEGVIDIIILRDVFNDCEHEE